MKNYDDLIPAAPPEQLAARSGNKYDEIIDAPDAPPVQVMAVSLSALSRNPEQSAKARTLGQRYGLPPSVIERNLPELEKRALQDTNSAVLQRSPKLSRFIGADPDRAAVAVDDLPTFGEIERTLGTPLPRRRPLTGAFKDAAAEARRTRDRFERALTGARSAGRAEETPVDYSITDRVRYGYGQARAGLPIAMNELTGLYEGDQFGLALAISDRLREAERANLATPPAAVTEGARRVGEAEGFVESGVAVLGSPAFVLDTVFTSLGQSAPSMLAGVAGAAAGPAGQALGAGTGSLAVEYSASLIESIREAGLTPTNAQEVYRALSNPALMDQARDKALKRGLAIGAFDALTAGLAGNILRNARGASRTAMAAAVAGEAGLQAAGGAGGELVAQLLTESSVRWGEVFLEGIAEIASGVVEVPSNLRAAREAAEARFARNDHNAMLAEYHANQVKQLSELAGASKVLARDPQTLQEFIDNVAREGGRVEDIYVDARQFAQTVGDEKLAELRQASPAVAAQIDEALAIGGDLVIPLGEFATTIGQSDVMPSVLELVRPDAAEMSLAEAKQFAQTRDDQMLAEAERALEEAGEASDFSRSAAAVEQRVTQELQTANRFTEAVNTRYAKLVSAFFTTMAKRTGVLPEQFAARYSLQVRNEAVQGERRMEQITPEQAMATNVPVELPNDPVFTEAVGNTSGAEITENGLLIDLVRFQKPEQEGAQAIRTGVFYLPAKSENVRHYKTTPSTKFPNPYGGSERMEGATLIRRPLFVKGATGGKAPEAAYDAIKGKGAMKSLDRAVMDVVTSRGFMTRTDPEAFLQRVEQFLGEWGGDRGLADEIIRNSTQGNTLRYALQEHVIAHAVREAGYDAVVGYSKGKAGARISEVFDVREQTFPARGMDSEVHSAFNQSAFTADTIEIDGKTRPALNSNGQRIAQTEEGLRNFWRWFGDSKVVDAEGRPLVVYHGTGADFDAFDDKKTGQNDRGLWGRGHYFSALVGGPNSYALRNEEGAQILPVYVALKNPLVLTTGEDLVIRLPDGRNFRELVGQNLDGEKIKALAKANGHDGVVQTRPNGRTGDVVAYRPEQIKSATGNRGTFDPADPKILNQSAYHGTPHRFERFSLEHIGAGEGVQAFGWGLYFTSERDIAEWYRRKLSEDQTVVNWRIGNRYIVRDEQVQDYSPRPASGDIGQAWSVAVEGLMLAESELRDTLYAGGDVRAKAAEILDEIIEIEKSGDYRQSFVFHLERIRDQARDGMVFDLTEAQGQVYQVSIPDETEMLAWDKPLSEQPEKVREALGLPESDPLEVVDADGGFAVKNITTGEILANNFASRDAAERIAAGHSEAWMNRTGAQFYERQSELEGSDEAASKYLNSIGVRGISYQADGGRTDARNFVVFDDSAIEVLNAFYQRQEALRGQITFGTDITRTPSVISLFEQANLSTFLHESGHFFLEVMADVAARGAQPQVMNDMDALLRWFGVPDLGTWLAMTPDQQRPYHEQFARGFERYLLEGKAPSRSLESLFATFRSWLLSVYRSLIGSAGGADAALNVTVSDEVRGVMDRMLASDEEIAEAQDARRYAPLFKSAAEMGATTAEWAAYQREHGDALEAAQAELGARSLREMRWLSGAKSRELKRLQGEAKAARAAVEEEATAEVRAEPVYAAMRWLKHGEMVNAEGEQIKALSGFKLDAERAREILTAGGLESTALGVGKYGMVAKEGLDPQVVAEMFGFPNGETLIHAIVGATPEADAIEALTDQRMLERYGELVDDRAVERAADAAVHNEARGRFVAVELRALTRALNKQARTPAGGSVNALARAARELADRIVLRKPIKDIKPAKFSTAEVRAAKAAEKALAGNDLTTAVTEKRNQMVNFYAARAAHNALGRFEVGLRKMKRALESEGIDQEYRDQIAAILDRYNLRPMTKKEQQRAKSLVAWVDAQKAAGYEPVIDEDVLNEARRVPVRDLTVEEFDGLVASVENIAHLGRLKKKLLTAKDAREFAARVDEAEAAIRDNATRTIPEQIEKGRLARFRSGVKEFFVMHRKFANTIYEMDGWRDGGALWELFVRPMNEAGDREAVMREQATIRLSELFKAVSKDARRKVFIPEIDTALTAEARIMVALNTGNAGNLQRLMDGDRWSIDQVKAITDTLTKEQWDFVQGVWDVIDEYRPMIAEQQKRITGVEPKWVEPTPVDTPHGVYRGGYFPAKYDTDRSTRSLSDEAAAGVMDQWRATRGAARTRDSFTRERAAKVIMRPLRKDFGVVTQHITEVTHRLAWQEYLIDATRLLNASQIDAAVREHYGPEVLRSMRDTIADVAAGEVGAQNAFEKAINHLRVGTTIVGLGWNLTTGLLQPIGLTQSMVRIGPKWVAKGLAQWLGNAARMESATAAIYEKSEFMRLRGKTMQREISEIRNTVSGTDSRLTASYFYFIQKLQIVADVPTWLGMYTKAIETMNVDEATAVALADQAVLDAQSGGQVKDLAAIQRGGPMLKLFTNFYSFFNTTFNLTRAAYGRTNFYKPGEAGLFLVDMLLLYTVPAVLGTLLKAALQGDTDDEDELVKKLIADQMNYLLGTMVGLREIGGATAAALGLPSGYSGPAGVRFFSEVQKLAKQTEQGEADAAFFKALNSSAGILFHYPAGQLNRTAEGVNAYLNGETENPAALIVGPPR